MPQKHTITSLRHTCSYRTVGPPGRERRWGCGFLLKPRGGGYRNLVRPYYVAVYVLRGTGTFTAGGRRHPVTAGCFCQHMPDEACSLEPDLDGQWAEAFINVDGPLYLRLSELGLIHRKPDVLHPGIDASLIQRFEEIQTSLKTLPDSSLSGTLVRAMDLLRLAQDLHWRERSGPDRLVVDQACKRLADDVEERIPLPALAQELGVGYDHFRKTFAYHTGMSPGKYRIRRRIDRARELILHRHLRNQEVADLLGYPDSFTFSRQFKQVTGESPAAFRQRVFG